MEGRTIRKGDRKHSLLVLFNVTISAIILFWSKQNGRRFSQQDVHNPQFFACNLDNTRSNNLGGSSLLASISSRRPSLLCSRRSKGLFCTKNFLTRQSSVETLAKTELGDIFTEKEKGSREGKRRFHTFTRFRGGTSNTVTEDTSSEPPWKDEPEYVPENRTVFGREVPEGYVNADDPPSDEDTEERKAREGRKAMVEKELQSLRDEAEWQKGGWFNMSKNPAVERAIICAGMALFHAKQNVTADKIYNMCMAVVDDAEEEIEIPYHLCLAYADFMSDPRRLDDLIYNGWRLDNNGKLIPQLAPGCGARTQGRIGVYDEPGSAIGSGGGNAQDGGGGKKEESKKEEKAQKKEETPPESEEEQEFDLFD